MNKLLLLEDDPNLAKTLIKYLNFNNYEIDWAKNGEEAIELSYHSQYQLYLFDINVPLINGIDLLTALRDAKDHTPTIIISAMTDVTSITQGFIAGADDYVKKPFNPEELLIRIKAKTATLKQRLKFQNYEIDLRTENIYNNGKAIFLGNVQKEIFIALVKHYPNPASYDYLLRLLERANENALRVNMTKLKKTLHIEIKNIRGVGYKII